MHGPAPEQEAILEFRDGAYRIVMPGTYVVCAVTGQRIALEHLRYWSVERQQAYVDAVAATQAMGSPKR